MITKSGAVIVAEINGNVKYYDLADAKTFLELPNPKESYKGIVCFYYTVLDTVEATDLFRIVIEHVREDQEAD